LGEVQECFSNEDETGIIVEGEKLYAEYVFNSILFRNALLSGNHHFLLQHFTGWVISTPSPVFVAGHATLMDFRTSQQHGTTFVYVMPFSPTEALVEYTIFSERLIDEDLYRRGLESYCRDILTLKEYTITEREFGSIPMTTYPFQHSHNNVINLGTAGGQTKASSGYTFQFIQEQTEKIVNALQQTHKPFVGPEKHRRRFDFYDAVLLNILAKKKMKGVEVFDRLMLNNDMRTVMKFLENKTSLPQDLRLIRNLPKGIFARAAVEELMRK
jgi:lycopene beta-cyclase